MAHMVLHDPHAASSAFNRGLELDPGSTAIKLQAQRSRAQAEYEDECSAAYRGLHQRDLVLKLRAVSSDACLLFTAKTGTCGNAMTEILSELYTHGTHCRQVCMTASHAVQLHVAFCFLPACSRGREGPETGHAPVQVRRREIEDSMERQFKQGMTAPDWEMDDYGW